jgi:hypothetical protein
LIHKFAIGGFERAGILIPEIVDSRGLLYNRWLFNNSWLLPWGLEALLWVYAIVSRSLFARIRIREYIFLKNPKTSRFNFFSLLILRSGSKSFIIASKISRMRRLPSLIYDIIVLKIGIMTFNSHIVMLGSCTSLSS